jgi:hypothetical protein
MRSGRAKRDIEHDDAARLAAKFDEMTLSFVSRIREAQIEAALAVNTLIGSQNRVAIADLFEQVLHAGIQEAINELPKWPISRCEFDALPVLPEGDDSTGRVGLCRKQLRSSWIIIHANSNETAGFFRPEMMDGDPPLH